MQTQIASYKISELSERDRIPICISHIFLGKLSLGMAVRKLFWSRFFKDLELIRSVILSSSKQIIEG